MDRQYRYDPGTFLVFVDGCERGLYTGRYLSPCTGESGRFSSLDRLLLSLEEALELRDQPQAFQTMRQFTPPVGAWANREDHAAALPGRIATFSLRIRFRRNTSWQGTVIWQDRRQTMHFRSVLELLRLMDSALRESNLLRFPMEG